MSAPASSTEPELDSQLGNSGRGQLAAHTARGVCLCESATEPGEEGVVVVVGRGVGFLNPDKDTTGPVQPLLSHCVAV